MESRGRSAATRFAPLMVTMVMMVVGGGGWLTGCSSRPQGVAAPVSTMRPDSAYADHWQARDAVVAACVQGAPAACLRAAFGPYLLSDVARWEVSRKGCALGEALACESGCVFELEELGERMMETMPAMRALGEATASAFDETCRRHRLLKPAQWDERVAKACAGERESPACLAMRELHRAELEDLEDLEDLEASPVRAAGTEPVALPRERTVALCASGDRPACQRLAASEHPLDASPACLAGERRTCSRLAAALIRQPKRRAAELRAAAPGPLEERDGKEELREEAARQLEMANRQVLGLLLQQCAAMPWACPTAIAPVESPWYQRFLLVEGAPAACPQALARARHLARLPALSPGRELAWAIASCERFMPEPHRTCLAAAKHPSALFNCAQARRPEEVLAAEASRLARQAQQFFRSDKRLPAAWPKTELFPACCGQACAPAAPATPSATPIYDENGELEGVENGDAEGQAYRDVEEEEESAGTYRYESDDDDNFEAELRSSYPKGSVSHHERYFWAHLMLEREGDVVIASARGRRTCDEPQVLVEERWQLVDGKPSRSRQTRRTVPPAQPPR